MQRRTVLVSALSFAFGVAGIEWRRSLFSRSVREIRCPLLEVKQPTRRRRAKDAIDPLPTFEFVPR
jgi:hypothetical protein